MSIAAATRTGRARASAPTETTNGLSSTATPPAWSPPRASTGPSRCPQSSRDRCHCLRPGRRGRSLLDDVRASRSRPDRGAVHVPRNGARTGIPDDHAARSRSSRRAYLPPGGAIFTSKAARSAGRVVAGAPGCRRRAAGRAAARGARDERRPTAPRPPSNALILAPERASWGAPDAPATGTENTVLRGFGPGETLARALISATFLAVFTGHRRAVRT